MSDIGRGSVSWRDGNEPKDKAVLRREPFRKYAVEAILTDLIAEQRELHHRMGFACSLCVTEWPCQCIESLDRAEERLREVTGDA